jgi:hypothetical protein
MRYLLGLLACCLLGATPVLAQETDDPARAGELRRRIEERFTARVQEDLGLSDQQAEKLRRTAGHYFDQRRRLETEERRIRAALAGELRPGVAANPQTVSRLSDDLLDVKVRYAESYRSESKELAGFLDPVQRAQYFILRERLLDRVRVECSERGPPARPLGLSPLSFSGGGASFTVGTSRGNVPCAAPQFGSASCLWP